MRRCDPVRGWLPLDLRLTVVVEVRGCCPVGAGPAVGDQHRVVSVSVLVDPAWLASPARVYPGASPVGG